MKKCKVKDCDYDGNRFSCGYCPRHYYQFNKYGKIISGPRLLRKANLTCKVEGCNNKAKARELCGKHYRQFMVSGKTQKRTLKDPNEFIIEGDICRIKLYNKNHEEVAETIIDAEDFNKVKKYKWSLKPDGYVVNTGAKTRSRLSRVITNAPKGFDVDHKNKNKLDNRKENLRIATRSQNNGNAIKRNRNGKASSKFKGVYFHKKNKKWISAICKNGKTTGLGSFSSEIEAAKAYDKAAIKLFGEFALTNEKLNLFTSKTDGKS